jgi:eukaryotic-like serine/threonine-protein kinase
MMMDLGMTSGPLAPPPCAFPETGQIIAGKYRLEERLGVGGMGVVYAAMHLELGERVALKLLLPSALHDATSIERFGREARAAAKVRGEHVVRIFDVGKLGSGVPFIAMELLAGLDLDRHTRGRKLARAEAADLVMQALVGVAEAHARGIVHRDLKPANLFITTRSDGSRCVKVLDFGVSKTLGSAERSLTQTSALLGSPLFMSPEQWGAAKDVDGRADIWAIGAILYQLLADRPPFDGSTVAHLCNAALHDEPRPLTDVPDGLDRIVRRCLKKDRAERFADVAELAAALAPFAPSGEERAHTIHAILGREAAPVSETNPLAQTESSLAVSRRALALRSASPFLVLVAVLLTIGAFAIPSGRSRTTTPPATARSTETSAALAPTEGAPIAAPERTPSASEPAAEPAAEARPRASDVDRSRKTHAVVRAASPAAAAASVAPLTSAPALVPEGSAAARARSELGGRH